METKSVFFGGKAAVYGITYIGSSVALESTVINLEVAILNIKSSTLRVPCGPPEHREASGRFCARFELRNIPVALHSR
jgi:hypothetical protein